MTFGFLVIHKSIDLKDSLGQCNIFYLLCATTLQGFTFQPPFHCQMCFVHIHRANNNEVDYFCFVSCFFSIA